MVKKLGLEIHRGPELTKKNFFVTWLHYGRVNFLGPNARIFQLNILELMGYSDIKKLRLSNVTFFIS